MRLVFISGSVMVSGFVLLLVMYIVLLNVFVSCVWGCVCVVGVMDLGCVY